MARTPRKTAAASPHAALLEEFKDFPGIAVLERRLENPELPGSLPIRLRDEPTHIEDPKSEKRTWYLRWVDSGESGRFSQVTDVQGYVPVLVTELQNPISAIGGAESRDGIVRRGDKGREILVKMPIRLYNAIKQAEREARERRAKNAKAVKYDLATAAGNEFGSQAGDVVHDEFSLSIKEHRGTLGGELGGNLGDGEVTEA